MDFIQINLLCKTNPVKMTKREVIDFEETFAKHISDKGSISENIF